MNRSTIKIIYISFTALGFTALVVYLNMSSTYQLPKGFVGHHVFETFTSSVLTSQGGPLPGGPHYAGDLDLTRIWDKHQSNSMIYHIEVTAEHPTVISTSIGLAVWCDDDVRVSYVGMKNVGTNHWRSGPLLYVGKKSRDWRGGVRLASRHQFPIAIVTDEPVEGLTVPIPESIRRE